MNTDDVVIWVTVRSLDLISLAVEKSGYNGEREMGINIQKLINDLSNLKICGAR